MPPRHNVLIFHSGALGDFVLTWPIAVALARLYPQSRVFYVTAGAKGKLAEKAIGVDAIDVEAGWHALFGENVELAEAVRKRLESAHTIVTFVSSGEHVWAKNVKRVAPEAALIALETPPRGAIAGGVHVWEFYLQQMGACPVVATATTQIVRSIFDRGIGGRLPADGRFLIHPGAGAGAKCWPVGNFADLAQALKAAGRTVEFVLGEVELEKWPKADVDRLAAIAPIQKPMDFVALYQLLRGVSCFIGNESGPGHLAGTVGVPTVVISPVGHESWKPLGPAVCWVGAREMGTIEVQAVLHAMKHAMKVLP